MPRLPELVPVEAQAITDPLVFLGGSGPVQVNLWGEVRMGMRNLDGLNDTSEWRKIAAFIRDSGGVSINSDKPKATA